ncbi:MAG: hypothetical protein AB7S99_23985, partial [Pseudodonghicola sp.]
MKTHPRIRQPHDCHRSHFRETGCWERTIGNRGLASVYLDRRRQGWVRNSVDDAIAAGQAFKAAGITVDLLHARFALGDRKQIEAAVRERFGKDGKGRAGRAPVGTQVLESSLDFDVMISDLAALVQRAGRLWRHMAERPRAQRPVPAPIFHVLAPDPAQVSDDRWLQAVHGGGAFVYPLADQWRTADHLFRRVIAPWQMADTG